MAATHIARVVVDPASKSLMGRTRYRITLACGCTWWEEHLSDAAPPDLSERRCSWHSPATAGASQHAAIAGTRNRTGQALPG